MRKALLLLMALTMVIVCFTACDSRDYKDAMELYEAGQYAEAADLFITLGDYENSAEMYNICKYEEAKGYYTNGDYENAKMIYSEIHDFKDCAVLSQDCEYNIANELYNSGDYEAAKQIYSGLTDYKDSANLVQECDYNLAGDLYDSGDYEAAKQIYAGIGDYKDSANLVFDCDYQTASALYNSGDYEAAIVMFESISDYSDSAEKIIQAKKELMFQNYGDVIALLVENVWYFNGGSDTILNGISFTEDEATVSQVYFDGNGRHDNGANVYTYVVDDAEVTVTMSDGSELIIPYTVDGGALKLGDNEYFTPEEVDASIQGHWMLRKSSIILGMSTANEYHISFYNGAISSEDAAKAIGGSNGEYYYYGPYSGTYTVGFGEFTSDMTHADRWFFNIIDDTPTILYYGSVCSRSSGGFPGKNGYSF